MRVVNLVLFLSLIFSPFVFSQENDEKPQEKINELAEEQSDNAASGGLHAAGAVSSVIIHKVLKNSIIDEEEVLEKDKKELAKAVKARENAGKRGPKKRSLNTRIDELNDKVRKRENGIKGRIIGGNVNYMFGAYTLAKTIRSIIDGVGIRNEMNEIINCNPSLITGAYPISNANGDNLVELGQPIDQIEKEEN